MLTNSGLRTLLYAECEVPGNPGTYYSAYGDAGYDACPVFGTPYARAAIEYSAQQRAFNANMSSQRIVVETVRFTPVDRSLTWSTCRCARVIELGTRHPTLLAGKRAM